MTYTTKQLQGIFQSQFNLSTWTSFIIDFFKPQEVKQVPEDLGIDHKDGNGYYLASLNTKDDVRISFFYLKLNSSIDRRKVGLRQLISKYIKIDSDAGIVVFDDGNHWRLSFITDMRSNKTAPKRYTFVFGENQSQYRTVVDRFYELQRKGITFDNIKEAFSVEALTKQFYNDLFNWYTWALDETTGIYFPNNPKTKDDDREHIDTKIIRLITRLMFVWFIKQKGLVPNALFNPSEVKAWLKDFDPYSMEQGNYYQAILQNLFFATLNRPIKNVTYDKDGNEIVERRAFAKLKDKSDVKSLYRYQELFKISEDKILSIFEHVPFINGGLFECLDKNKTSDGVEQAYYNDGFSRNNIIKDGHYTHRAFIPNNLFFSEDEGEKAGILTIFSRYNFTVEENSPSEQQIALDPELLGKVFENLLGVYNPETHDTARSQSGSFYTPREIVNYMTDISLQAYLGNTDEVKAIFKDDFEYNPQQKDFYDEIIEKLTKIKVLDPACGSGAFPMGMLNRIVELMQRLNAPGDKYDLKLQIMENCIYGGDIQTIAAQITKLRFFISLICDCKKTDNADDNYGIPNLPNLETHFVTCDSLIGLKKPQEYSLFEQDVIALKAKLQEVRHEHFTAKTVYQKTKLRNRDKELRNELTEMLKSDNVIASEDAIQMAAWNPYDQNAQSPFFDPEWMFGIKDGFDVVIGNPPYIRLQKNDGLLANRYEPCIYKTFDRDGDIYCLFYEKGYSLLKQNGVLCYITSNKWMRAGYGDKTRYLITKHTNPILLIDFASVKIFEGATVDTNILLFRKTIVPNHTTQCVAFTKSQKKEVNNLYSFVENQCVPYQFREDGAWIVLDEMGKKIKDLIEEKGMALNKWNVSINRGLLTGYNKAFIIDEDTRNSILASCETSEERSLTESVIAPMLRGRDIYRYNYVWAHKYIINTHNGIRGIKPKVDINKFPALKAYLDSHWNKISRRGDKGDTPYNLRNCAYLEDFCKPKVMWKIIGCNINFAFDDSNMYCNNAVNIMPGDRSNMLQFVGLMNSKLFDWYLKVTTEAEVQGGGVQLYVTTLEKTPLKLDFDSSFSETVEKRVKNLISDEEMDKAVFDVYGLSDTQRQYILNSEEANRVVVEVDDDE